MTNAIFACLCLILASSIIKTISFEKEINRLNREIQKNRDHISSLWMYLNAKYDDLDMDFSGGLNNGKNKRS